MKFCENFLFNDQHWMERALILAQRAAIEGEVPVGALVVIDGEVIGEGWNCPIARHDPTAHAEIIALRSAAERCCNYRLVGATLYVTLEPCVMCVGALVQARIKRLVFGAHDPKAGALESVFKLCDEINGEGKLNHKFECTGGVLADECGGVLTKFFQDKRRLKREL